MEIKRNLIMVAITLLMSLGTWYMPENWTAETHQQRVLALTNFNTNPIRMGVIQKYCKGINRADLISSDEIQTSIAYRNQLASQFTITGNTFINKAINGGDVAADAQKDSTAFGLFAGVFVIGLFFLLSSSFFLLCCCCCPSCCPSKCCQKNENEQYTKCQLYWPSITLILALLTIVVGGAIGFSKASSFSDGLGDMTCAISIMFDDIINGNVTTNGNNFFIGVSQLITEVNNLNTNMGTVQTQIGDLTGASMTGARSNIAAAKTKISEVPDGTAGNPAAIQYSNKDNFQVAPTASNYVQSKVNTILGQSSPSSGIIGLLYSNIDQIDGELDGIQTSSSGFSSASAGFGGQITNLVTELDKLKVKMNDLSSQLQSSLGFVDTPNEMGTMIFQIIYGVAIGFAVLALIGVVLMTFCDKYKCRYLMYFACIILFFFAIIGFFIAIIFSIIVPVLYWGCDWLSITIGSGTGFQTNLNKFLDASISGYITPCLKDGSGDLVTAVAPTAAQTINNLTNSISLTNSFDMTQKLNILNAKIADITGNIDGIYNGLVIDLDYSNAVSKLVHVTYSSNFVGSCASLTGTSWAYGTGSYGPCTLPTPHTYKTGSSAECDTPAQVSSAASTCTGCLDSTSIFNTLYPTAQPAGTWATALGTRYAGCTAFNTYFGNVWDNYYNVKIPAVKAIKTRWDSVVTNEINTMITSFNTLKTTMDGVKANLQGAVDSITNPQFGLIAGLNCKLIGQDLELMVNSICVSNFNTFYITRIAMGIISIGILVAMCCIVCSGVRHFKHSERKDKIAPALDNTKNSFEDTDAAFKP